eukprot:TRINITY_DN16262_c0_g1_i13.p1 TRINITY_DN16262_c0_g1~~TRINITY_DN16262_c0_g1_i13.p1  ORF type:complete len:363 (-),score=72.48 TRINITY_DN16262_c0_g1_i13:196-1284(-)
MKASPALLVLVWITVSSECCSHFLMNYTKVPYTLSVRTMDLGGSLEWTMHSFPRGLNSHVLGMAWTSKYGYVGFTPGTLQALNTRIPLDGLNLGLFSARDVVSDGLNEAGLSCGFLTLTEAKFEKLNPLKPNHNLFSYSVCKWALEQFETVEQVADALAGVQVWWGSKLHFALVDADQNMLVVEYLDGERQLRFDSNDDTHGFGIMTNEPAYDWQIRNVQHLEWKRTLARSAVSIPGNFYPDERFLRVHLMKQAIERTAQPVGYREAVAKAVAIVNTVTVPMGDIPGTDSGSGSGEGSGDHTQWGVIRQHDRSNATYLLRSQTNPSWRRIELGQLDLDQGSPIKSMQIEDDPWYLDVTNNFR